MHDFSLGNILSRKLCCRFTKASSHFPGWIYNPLLSRTTPAVCPAGICASPIFGFFMPLAYYLGSELQGEFVTLTTVQARCPSCQSTEVFYSCTPNCCFNHICSECQSSFELSTSPLPGSGPGLDMDAAGLPPEPDACSPTAPCAKCQGIRVYQLSDGEALFCLDCRALLKLGYENVAGP